eukprot:GHVQ01036243.1.p1 GENE.GHVQ01036243.1~~GHVQ01036243.1.p1  ORF type:complete len:248 (-),score=36.13 GHVQ01036243.1:974-1717(-)
MGRSVCHSVSTQLYLRRFLSYLCLNTTSTTAGLRNFLLLQSTSNQSLLSQQSPTLSASCIQQSSTTETSASPSTFPDSPTTAPPPPTKSLQPAEPAGPTDTDDPDCVPALTSEGSAVERTRCVDIPSLYLSTFLCGLRPSPETVPEGCSSRHHPYDKFAADVMSLGKRPGTRESIREPNKGQQAADSVRMEKGGASGRRVTGEVDVRDERVAVVEVDKYLSSEMFMEALATVGLRFCARPISQVLDV